MFRRMFAVAVFAGLLAGVGTIRAADTYTVDPIHSSVSFKIEHAGISYVHGRFNQFEGSFTVDKSDPSQCSFSLSIKAESVDTANKNRDTHLRSGDFFNVKQFPTITFKSTSVKAADDGFEVTGDLTMHGETKAITFKLHGGKETEFPPKVKRTGYWTDLKINRSDFGMKTGGGAIGDAVEISIGLEGTRK